MFVFLMFFFRYLALYAYKPQKADELELRKGEMYRVTEKCQDGWFKGTSLRTAASGVFPGNYVTPVSRSVRCSRRTRWVRVLMIQLPAAIIAAVCAQASIRRFPFCRRTKTVEAHLNSVAAIYSIIFFSRWLCLPRNKAGRSRRNSKAES